MIDSVFFRIQDIYGQFDIDVFAPSRNPKFVKYAAMKPHCRAFAINAFSLVWSGFFAYIFCPFSVLGAALQKILQDSAEALVIAPFFMSQPSSVSTIIHPSPCVSDTNNTRRRKLSSEVEDNDIGSFSSLRDCLQGAGLSSWHPGEVTLKNNMCHISKNGVSIMIGHKLISFNHL